MNYEAALDLDGIRPDTRSYTVTPAILFFRPTRDMNSFEHRLTDNAIELTEPTEGATADHVDYWYCAATPRCCGTST